MDNRIGPTLTEIKSDGHTPCPKQFLLCELKRGKPDKLGHRVEDILCITRDYAIYRSEKGVYVQFSDSPQEEDVQRKRFAELCPELCDLRYLTSEMRGNWRSFLGLPTSSSLYDYNIAQAIRLVMEEDAEGGKRILQQALKMAVPRVTNDNTIRYVRFCLFCWLVAIVAGAGFLHGSSGSEVWRPYVVAGMLGATGALLSIASRLQTLELKPCNQSNMNYWMSGIRIGIGVISGMILLLLAPTTLSDAMMQLVPEMKKGSPEVLWQTAATFGLIGGFAERLVPNLLRLTNAQMEGVDGTTIQAVGKEKRRENFKTQSLAA